MSNICAFPGCDDPVTAKRKDALYCSDRHRKAAQRLPPAGLIPDPDRVATKLIEQRGATRSARTKLNWEEIDEVTWKLTDGRMERQPAFYGRPGYETTRTLASVLNKSHQPGHVSWHAVCNGVSIGPSTVDDSGLSKGRPTLADMKMVARAMATQDVRTLLRRAHSLEDCTDDMRLNLTALLALIAKAR